MLYPGTMTGGVTPCHICGVLGHLERGAGDQSKWLNGASAVLVCQFGTGYINLSPLMSWLGPMTGAKVQCRLSFGNCLLLHLSEPVVINWDHLLGEGGHLCCAKFSMQFTQVIMHKGSPIGDCRHCRFLCGSCPLGLSLGLGQNTCQCFNCWYCSQICLFVDCRG